MSTTEPLRTDDRMPLAGLEGTTLSGYTMLRLIAEGGMGAVYEARGPRQQRVAVKLLKPEFSRDAEMRKKFLSEIAKLSRLKFQRGIVEMLDEFSDRPDRLAIVMEYLDGTTLRVRLGEVSGRRLPIELVLAYGAQVAYALAAMHRSKIAHGDLKPENIMVLSDGPRRERIKIIDLGIAGWLIPSGLTRRETELWGSGPYQAPELQRTRRPTAESDVFAFGQILYECLAGSLEEEGGELDEAVPSRLRRLIAAMRRESATERPEISFVLHELTDIIESEYPREQLLPMGALDVPPEAERSGCAVHMLPVYPDAQARRRGGRQRLIYGLGALSAVCIVLILIAQHRAADPEIAEDNHPAMGFSIWRHILSLLLGGIEPAGELAQGSGDIGRPALPPAHRHLVPANSLATPAMTLIPAGVAMVGSALTDSQQARARCLQEACSEKERCAQAERMCKTSTFANEVPIHRVLITQDFYIDNDLVTATEWAEFLNNLSPRLKVDADRDTHVPRFVNLGAEKFPIYDLHPAASEVVYAAEHFSVKPGREAQPVKQITWIGALYYCRYKGKELLNEVSWEYVKTNRQLAKGSPRLDMSPGLGEWMADVYRPYPMGAAPYVEPGKDKIDIDPASYHVVRGCSHSDLPVFCRPAARGYQLASNAPLEVGFRCMQPVQTAL